MRKMKNIVGQRCGPRAAKPNHHVDRESLDLEVERRSKEEAIVHVKIEGTLQKHINAQGTVVVKMGDIRRDEKSKYDCNRKHDGTWATDVINIREGSAYYFKCAICGNGSKSPIVEASTYYHEFKDRVIEENVEIFGMSDLEVLKRAAINFISAKQDNLHKVDTLFRNNHRQYFDDINRNKGGIMEVSPKNPNGDPRCPAVNVIKGIEFSVGNDRRIPKRSPFDDKRFIVDVDKLVDPEINLLYFADFYCHAKRHDVTLVVTEPTSDANAQCEEKLRPLPMITRGPKTENPFFYYDAVRRCFLVTFNAWVEILYTKNVDLKLGNLSKKTFQPRNVGYGKPKNASCTVCNISSLTTPPIKRDCPQDKCRICSQITSAGSVKSKTHGTSFSCLKNVNCQVENVIYLIECGYPGCGMQYVGKTQHALRKRITQHENDIKQDRRCETEKKQCFAEQGAIFEETIRNRKSLPEHVNSHDQNERPKLKIAVLEIVPQFSKSDANSDLIRAMEKEWITRLGTLAPDGINKQL